ncbi:hypothetical protein M3J09_013023 [Ascochyta lentis]
MRTFVLITLASAFGMSDATRRGCKSNPANPGEGWYHTTSSDTLNKVAADFCTTPAIINQWNNRRGELSPGINIKVPCHHVTRDCSNKGYYTIVSGDTLTKIAPDFCTNAQELERLNKQIKNPDYIVPGQIISVPCNWH